MNTSEPTTKTHANRNPVIHFDKPDTLCSIVFTFLIDPENEPGNKVMPGVRLEYLRESLMKSEAHQALIDPLESFVNDVIAPVFRRNSVPLIALAEPKEKKSAKLDVTWPGTLTYTAEGDAERLPAHHLAGIVRFDWQDSVAIFESGHVAYIVALLPCPPEPSVTRAANEYDILLLQKLIDPTESLTWTDSARSGPLREAHAFSFCDESGSDSNSSTTFIKLVRNRLEKLLREPKHKGDPLRQILNMAELDGRNSPLEKFKRSEWRCLAGGIVHVDGAQNLMDDILRFRNPNDGKADDRILTLAGIIQNVIDFPRQDEAELRDSFHPVLEDNGRMVFNHPRFLHQFTTESRSLAQMKDSLGACPYLLLTHLLVTYNERLLQNAEQEVGRLVYGESKSEEIRVDPLRPLFDMLDETRIIDVKTILKTRLTVFRNLEFPSIPNAFRYPTEQRIFQEVSAARGLLLRKERFDAFFSRYESSLRDLHALTELKSNRQRDLLLLGITLLTIFDPIYHFNEYAGMGLPEKIMRGVLTFLGLVSLVVVSFAVGPMTAKLWRSCKVNAAAKLQSMLRTLRGR